MNYINTATDLLIQMPGVPQTNTIAGYSNTVEIMKKHIIRATSIVNGKIVNKYDISSWTTTTAPPTLRSLCEDIVTFYTLRSLYDADNQNVNDWAEKYADAMEELNAIRDGKEGIYDSTGSIIEERSTSGYDVVESNTEDYKSTFDEDSALNQKIDTDKITDIRDDRD